MDREALRALDRMLIGNDYPDEVLDALLPAVNKYLDDARALRALPVADVPNALVSVAGGRK